MSSVDGLPAFPPGSLTREQAIKLAQIAKEAREKYEKSKKEAQEFESRITLKKGGGLK